MGTIVKVSAAPLVKPKGKDATLELYQTCSKMQGGPVLLGTIDLVIPDGVAPEGNPAGFSWGESKPGATQIALAKGVAALKLRREPQAGYTVRELGGHGRRATPRDPAELKTGYAFADAEAKEAELFKGMGVGGLRDMVGVDLHVAGKTFSLPFLYPASPYGCDWLFGEHTLSLSGTLTMAEGGESKSFAVDGPEIVWRAHEFTAESGKGRQELIDALTKEYGNSAVYPPLHPRDYSNYVSIRHKKLDPLRRAINRTCIEASTFINSQIPEGDAFTVSPQEIACTLFAEGFSLVMEKLREDHEGKEAEEDTECPSVDQIEADAYQHLGADTYVTRYRDDANLRRFTSARLKEYIDKGERMKELNNEKTKGLHTFSTLPLVDGVYAVAGLYAQAKQAWVRDLASPERSHKWAMKARDLPAHVQFFWATLYYNTGPEHGRKQLPQLGLSYHDQRWMQEDDSQLFELKQKYNANWRTATFRLFSRTTSFEQES